MDRPRHWLRREVPALLTCTALGVLISILPHLLWWPRLNSPTWIADNDDMLYLSYAGRAYLEHPLYLSDPVRIEGGPTMYPWIQFVPGIVMAKAFDWGPTGILLSWRIFAGIAVAIGWYVLVRRTAARPWVAAALAIVLLADTGVVWGRPLVRQAAVTFGVATGKVGDLFFTRPHVHDEWRLITPALSLVFLLVQARLLFRAREEPTRWNILFSGIGFGLLFHVYFYYWTAAGLALVLALALDIGHRRVYFHTGWIGGLIGAPAVVAGYLQKQGSLPDWLHRTDKFLTIARTSELLIPKGTILLLLFTSFWIWFRRRDLLYLWALVLSGLALENHQLLTRMQMENFHWAYVWGPGLTALLTLLIIAPVAAEVGARRGGTVALLAFAGLFFTIGLWLRGVEANRTHETLGHQDDYRHYRAQRAVAPRPLRHNQMIAGDRPYVDLAAVLDDQRPLDHYALTISSSVSNEEWDSRIALNRLLIGDDRERFEKQQGAMLDEAEWGPWAKGRDPKAREDRLRKRLAAYDRAAAKPDEQLDRFAVAYVARPTSRSMSPPPGTGWRLAERGPYWFLWERAVRPMVSARSPGAGDRPR